MIDPRPDSPATGAHSNARAEVGHIRRESFDAVLGQHDRADAGRDPDARATLRAPRLAEDVADEMDILRPTLDVDGDPLLASAIDDPVRFHPVAVRPEVPPPRLV